QGDGQAKSSLVSIQALKPKPRVLVSYSYFEKDQIQADNLEFFLDAALNQNAQDHVTYVIVVSGSTCTPCERASKSFLTTRATLLHRDNDGMDFGAHNSTWEHLSSRNTLWTFAYYFLLNSSVKGPFYPSYFPDTWHWTDAYISRFGGMIHAVGSSLVCLPDVDAGEYGMSKSLFSAGYNIATLMSRYAKVFVKSSWHVADPYTSRYARWRRQHIFGGSGTDGKFDKLMYHYAIRQVVDRPGSITHTVRTVDPFTFSS
ncbi:hypothetical protein TSOC_011428, partial [Tetrabaena socialis]